MANNEILLTAKGFAELEEELNELRTTKREENIQAIKEAIPAIKQIFIDKKNDEFTAQIQMTGDLTPRWLTYDMMSDGFKSMINIVAEIAYRCIELNGFLGKDAVKKTPGIVMIDEVDLYLHPHWQQHILEDLQKAFPMFQFIVTTHSPFIVQSVESKNVITLDGNKGDSNPNMRSIEDIAITEMNMESARFPRYTLMLEQAEKYYQLVKAGKENTEEANDVKRSLDEIEEQFSAITFLIDKEKVFVAFRGTDDTIVGWKEDFNLAFKEVVPAQNESLSYLENVIDYFSNKKIL